MNTNNNSFVSNANYRNFIAGGKLFKIFLKKYKLKY